MPLPLQLPTLQNWSCHNCGGCCRQHEIEITSAERERIVAQNWTVADGIPAGSPVIERMGAFPWNRRWRLAHQPDGACLFLDDKGLCRIHAKFGEPAKPLACRVYPFAFHPAGRKIAVGLRFSCPSVVANRGASMSRQQGELKELERLVVPESAREFPPPRLSSKQQLDWPDTLQIIAALDATLATEGEPFVLKMLWSLGAVDLIGQASFERVRGPRLADFLSIVTQAVKSELPTLPRQTAPPGAIARQLFRMLVAQYARRDTFRSDQRGIGYRWKLLRAIWSFAAGRGELTPLQEGFQAVPFEALETSFGPIPAESEEVLTRYVRVKLQSLHFCGRAYYDVPLVEGFASLGLAVVCVCYLARWLARGAGRDVWTADDFARAVTVVDHHHGYSPALGMGAFRQRQRLLWKQKEVTRLLAHYSN
ncbi:MAG: YkgJ family cysteine cluster protein [Planctomycetota bacterium]|nr:YkgJ family cysteine cluster protein [Planctomycetota bacterium]